MPPLPWAPPPQRSEDRHHRDRSLLALIAYPNCCRQHKRYALYAFDFQAWVVHLRALMAFCFPSSARVSCPSGRTNSVPKCQPLVVPFSRHCQMQCNRATWCLCSRQRLADLVHCFLFLPSHGFILRDVQGYSKHPAGTLSIQADAAPALAPQNRSYCEWSVTLSKSPTKPSGQLFGGSQT